MTPCTSPALDGVTYALGDEGPWTGGRPWTVDTGWTRVGLGLDSGLLFAGSANGLRLSTPTRANAGGPDLGDWSVTAPAVGRDTLFVGGDRLWALDPTEGGGDAGPPVRFERSFHGRVGPGPCSTTGRCTSSRRRAGTTHLLALS
ncbi:hypothetical protein ACFQRB_20635 [Halobaculum litoreum]|uniref:PQQ-like domain-containing protein n=1 Tax=Halobaculum litoreum TaxID=3031998 RepID=A0ABD5XUE1_9EURY